MMTERRTGTYAAVRYDKASCEALKALMTLWNVPNPINPDHFHSTLIYSRKPVPEDKQHNMDHAELKRLGWKFPISGFRMMDSSSEIHDKTVLVLMLHAPELEALHDKLIASGATHDFESYDAHITISYSAPGFDWSKIQIPDVSIVPEEIYFEPLNANWKDEE